MAGRETGRDSASSVQSKHAGTGVEPGNMELGGKTGGSSCKIAAAGVVYSGGSAGGK